MIGPISDIPLTAWWPVGTVLLVLGLLVALVAVRAGTRRQPRALLGLLSVVAVLASVGVGVNAHYGYFRTLGEALGAAPPGETTLDRVRTGARAGQGTVVPFTIPPTASGFAARQAQVYLPPAWSTPRQAPLPVVLLLHGTPGNPTDWVEGGQAQVTADAWASQHGGVAPVLVMPDINGSMTGDTERSLPSLAQRFGLVPATPAEPARRPRGPPDRGALGGYRDLHLARADHRPTQANAGGAAPLLEAVSSGCIIGPGIGPWRRPTSPRPNERHFRTNLSSESAVRSHRARSPPKASGAAARRTALGHLADTARKHRRWRPLPRPGRRHARCRTRTWIRRRQTCTGLRRTRPRRQSSCVVDRFGLSPVRRSEDIRLTRHEGRSADCAWPAWAASS